ncbi:electron transfer flavoprotein [Halobacteriales archaeon QS_1_68_20]|nr:MAG: electron transfer flavoprotein [Halobacteriales archaeon QS_1_68_20]
MYDFAVVGAGPAGSRFARRAAEAGYDVVAFERGEVGKPLACSGHVSLDLWEYTPEGAREQLLQNEITGAHFHVGGPDSRAYTFYKREAVSNVIDRVQLDKLLAETARDAGAEVHVEHTVTDVREHADRVELDVKHGGETETVRAKMVAGCDGPTSRVRQALDLPEPGELLHGVLAFDPEPDHGDRVDVHLTAPSFFAWRIPRGEAGVEYGLAAPPDEDRGARELFEELTAGYDVETEHFCSGAIPIGPPDSVTGHRGFLIGDAAAQTKPFTGGGILYGMTAADHAVRTVDPDAPATLADYERAWRADLSREIRLGHWLRRAYELPEPVQRVGLRLFSGEIGVHMDRPTSLFSREHLRKWLS